MIVAMLLSSLQGLVRGEDAGRDTVQREADAAVEKHRKGTPVIEPRRVAVPP